MKHCGPLSTALVQAMCSACIEPPASCLTAISSKHHASCLECWQLDAVPVSSRAIINFNLSELEKGFLGILRPRTTSDGTLTNAQAVQCVYNLYPLRRPS